MGRLRRKDNSLVLERGGEEDGVHVAAKEHLEPIDCLGSPGAEKVIPDTHIPIESVESLFCFGETVFTMPVLRFLGRANVPLHIFDYYGNYSSTFYPRDEMLSGLCIVEQVRHFLDPELRLALAREIVHTSLCNIDTTLAYYEHRGIEVTHDRMEIQLMRDDVTEATGLRRVMGCEGYARRKYFNTWKRILYPVPFDGRRSRPSMDPVNALLSFCNALLYAVTTSELYRAGLNPMISYLHEPAARRFSLSLDIADIFKPVISDRLVFGLFNTGVLNIENHFEQRDGACCLNEKGRILAVKKFDEKMKTTIEHRDLHRSVSYRQLVQVSCAQLATMFNAGQRFKGFHSWW